MLSGVSGVRLLQVTARGQMKGPKADVRLPPGRQASAGLTVRGMC